MLVQRGRAWEREFAEFDAAPLARGFQDLNRPSLECLRCLLEGFWTNQDPAPVGA